MTYAGDVTPSDAWSELGRDKAAQLVDVRTRPEWAFVGTPDLARHGKKVVLLAWQDYPAMQVNPSFMAELAKAVPDRRRAALFPLPQRGALAGRRHGRDRGRIQALLQCLRWLRRRARPDPAPRARRAGRRRGCPGCRTEEAGRRHEARRARQPAECEVGACARALALRVRRAGLPQLAEAADPGRSSQRRAPDRGSDALHPRLGDAALRRSTARVCGRARCPSSKAVEIVVDSARAPAQRDGETTDRRNEPAAIPVESGAASAVAPAAIEIGAPLDPRFTFENFVVGKPNELAYAAARRVAEAKPVSVQPAVPLWRRRARQDAPDARHRLAHPRQARRERQGRLPVGREVHVPVHPGAPRSRTPWRSRSSSARSTC